MMQLGINLEKEYEIWLKTKTQDFYDEGLSYKGKFIEEKLQGLEYKLEDMIETNLENKQIDFSQLAKIKSQLNQLKKFIQLENSQLYHETKKMEHNKLEFEEHKIVMDTYPNNPIYKYLIGFGITAISAITGFIALGNLTFDANTVLALMLLYSIPGGLIFYSIMQWDNYEKTRLKKYNQLFKLHSLEDNINDSLRFQRMSMPLLFLSLFMPLGLFGFLNNKLNNEYQWTQNDIIFITIFIIGMILIQFILFILMGMKIRDYKKVNEYLEEIKSQKTQPEKEN